MTRLFVCSTGGHLGEMVQLAPRLTPSAERHVWLTFDTPQSREILRGEEVVFARETPPRDWRAIAYNSRRARKLFERYEVTSVVSSGAGIALAFLPQAALSGIQTHYIECSARTLGPSLTGKLLRLFPNIHLYTQHEGWADRRWHFRGSVFDGYRRGPVDAVSRPDGPLRILVTVGTLEFPFRRLFERLKHITDHDAELVIQAGPEAHRLEWPGTVVRESMPPGDLARELERADVVVSHAGIGSSLAAFEAGKLPVLIPRRQAFDEHVDDHQLQVAEYFSDRMISLAVDADDLEPRHLELAAAHSVVRADQPAFSLLA